MVSKSSNFPLVGKFFKGGPIIYILICAFQRAKWDLKIISIAFFFLQVVAAAFVHYHGISEMALHRVTKLGPMCPPNFPMVPTTTGLDGGENDTTHM